VNEKRIEAVSGAFVLGMDRGVTLARERNALYEQEFSLSDEVRPLDTSRLLAIPPSGGFLSTFRLSRYWTRRRFPYLTPK
jgi:hypothetical protein